MEMESLFDPLSKDEWHTILNEANQFAVIQGGLVFEEGDNSNSIMILIEGDLEYCDKIGDQYNSVAVIKQGEVFGEISFFDGESRAKSVIAKTDVIIGEITQPLFSKLRIHNPNIAIRFLIEASRNLAKRYRTL